VLLTHCSTPTKTNLNIRVDPDGYHYTFIFFNAWLVGNIISEGPELKIIHDQT